MSNDNAHESNNCNEFENYTFKIKATFSEDNELSFQVSVSYVHTRSVSGRSKNAYELLNLIAVKIATLHKNCFFQCMGKIFCVEFRRYNMKFNRISYPLKDVHFIINLTIAVPLAPNGRQGITGINVDKSNEILNIFI